MRHEDFIQRLQDNIDQDVDNDGINDFDEEVELLDSGDVRTLMVSEKIASLVR